MLVVAVNADSSLLSRSDDEEGHEMLELAEDESITGEERFQQPPRLSAGAFSTGREPARGGMITSVW